MPWMKVDDGLHKHRKRVRVGVTLDGFAAMGLWAVAGSWSADELTDGFVPDDVLDYLAPGVGRELAARLERAGFWHRITRDGEDGWLFHDWSDKNPTREEVLRERKAAAARQQRARDRARAKRDEQDQAEDTEPSRRDSGVTHAGVTPAVAVPPTRPDPTPNNLPSEGLFDAPPPATPTPEKSTGTKRGPRKATRIPDDFAVTDGMAAWAAKEIPHLNVRTETDKFRDYWTAKSGKDATKSDWPAAWRYWMRNAAERTPNTQPRSSARPGGHEPYRNADDDEYTRWINQ